MNKAMRWMTLQPLFAPEGEGAGAGADTTAGGGADTVAGGADTVAGGSGADTVAGGGAAKWWEAFPDPARQFLTAKGLTIDDQAQVLPKVIEIARNAEQRIGKGLDTILDRPAKDQAYGEWARANAVALGLPDKEDGYKVEKPEFWPKDMSWDSDLEGKAKALAFKHGIPATALQDFITLQAGAMKAMDDASKTGMDTARQTMMAELTRDFGAQTDARIALSKQGLQYIGEQSGISGDALKAAVQSLTDKTGDAAVIRLFAKVGELMGEDALQGVGKGGGFSTTPAEARAELAALRGPEGAYSKAVSSGDRVQLADLSKRIEALSRIAAQS